MDKVTPDHVKGYFFSIIIRKLHENAHFKKHLLKQVGNKLTLTLQKLGCDNVIGSDMRENECGICGGREEDCQSFSDTLNKWIGRKIKSKHNCSYCTEIDRQCIQLVDLTVNFIKYYYFTDAMLANFGQHACTACVYLFTSKLQV